jgi:hypothetical protein
MILGTISGGFMAALRVHRKPLTKKLKHLVWEKTRGLCWYCGKAVVTEDPSWLDAPNIDHVHPVTAGGTDDLENLVLACFRCNGYKGPMTLQQFRQKCADLYAADLEAAIESLYQLRETCKTHYARGIEATLRDLAALARRANFCFYGETMNDPEPASYEI